MSEGAQAFEAYLVRLYVDADERALFLADPRAAARAAGLDEPACAALARIDRAGLELAARSFEHKRSRAAKPRSRLTALVRHWKRKL